MKKIIIICVQLFSVIFYSCNSESNKSFVTANKNNVDTLYSDIDLFTFRGITAKGKINKYLTLQNLDSKRIITVFNNKQSNKFVYLKNSEGYYYMIQEENNDGLVTITYTIYSQTRIVEFILFKHPGDTGMKLGSHSIIFPIDAENKQRELVYKYPLKEVKSFEEILYIDILKSDIKNDYETESFYAFDFKTKTCDYISIENGSYALNNRFKIGNSNSVASPLFNSWIVID